MRKTMSLLLIAGAMALSAAEPLWKNGVPPPLAEDNPYLSGARNIVKLNYNPVTKCFCDAALIICSPVRFNNVRKVARCNHQ